MKANLLVQEISVGLNQPEVKAGLRAPMDTTWDL
jgi:hypothetical protein